MRRCGLALVAVALALVTAGPAPAGAAEYGLPEILSRPSATEQPLGPASQPDVSPDGRFVVYLSIGPNIIASAPPSPDEFQVQGAIYRLDRQTGATDLVAYAYGQSGVVGFYSGASSPSISADGRHVLFFTDKLRPGDLYGPARAYLRDMDVPLDDPAAYRDIDVLPGESEPAGPIPTGFQVPAGGALSDDGRRLVFLDGLGNLYWRDLDAGVTRAVSVRYDASSGTMTDSIVALDAVAALTVVLSGDGTTVAWMTADAFPSVRHQPGEPADEGGEQRTGVLWRRVADGVRAPIRQLSGTVDLDDPDCRPDTPVVPDPQAPPGPCDNTQLTTGAYQVATSGEVQPVSISRDGTTVAFLSKGHARGLQLPQDGVDAYVTTVFPHQPRKQAIQPLTRIAPSADASPCGSGASTVAAAEVNSCVQSVAVSPDGRYVALVSARTVFVLNPPSLVGTPPAGVGAQELYLVDRVANTLQLLTRTATGAKQDVGPVYGGGNGIGQGVTTIALGDDAESIVFASSADNLAPGDANENPDVFGVSRQATGAGSGLTGPEIEQLPPIAGRLEPVPDWTLRVAARSLAGGAVALDVTAPAGGTLRAIARSAEGGALLAQAGSAVGASGKATLTLRAPRRRTVGPAQRVTVVADVSFTPADAAAGAVLRQPVAVVLTRAARAQTPGPSAEKGEPRLAVSARRAARGAVTLVASVPAAGVVTATATRGGHTTARVRRRARRKGAVRLTLRPRGARGRVTVTVRYAPATGTAHGPRTRRLTVTAGGAR